MTEREEVVNEILRRYGLPTFEWQDLAEEILSLLEEELAHARNEAYDEAREQISDKIAIHAAPCFRTEGCVHEFCAGVWSAQDTVLDWLPG